MASATTKGRARPKRRTVTVNGMLRMSKVELDEVFRAAEPGPIPAGVTNGTPIVASGTPVGPRLAPLLRLGWRGKVFAADGSYLHNRIGPVGVRAIRAEVYTDSSWLDQREAIILDYSRSTPGFRAIRDEIREVAPGRYLGIVWWEHTETIHFALERAT